MAMAQRERRQPSRMTLSPDVARTTPRTRRDDRPSFTERHSPFGGMNQTEARIGGGRHMARSQAQIKRSTGGREVPEQDKKKDRPMYHALKMQATLTPLSYGQRNAIKEKLAQITSFDQLKLLPAVHEAIHTQALEGMTGVVPTPVQRVAIPTLLNTPEKPKRRRRSLDDPPDFNQFLIAAETGSGKTLAYMLPLVDAIKRAEVVEAAEEAERKAKEDEEERQEKKPTFQLTAPPLSHEPHDTAGRPRAIILLPTSELVTQIGSVLKKIAWTVKFRSGVISAANSPVGIRKRLFNPNGIDVLVSTPHLICSIAKTEPNILSRVTHLVIDEADSLLDRSFGPTITEIIDKVTPSLKQLIMCSATIPTSMDRFLDKKFPEVRRLVTPNLHAIPRRVQLGVVDTQKDPFHGNKNLACADVIWQIGKAIPEEGGQAQHSMKCMLVFVNEREKATEVAEYLQRKGIDAKALTRDTPEERQSELLSTFTSASKIEADAPESSQSSQESDFIPFDRPHNSAPSTVGHKKLPNTKVLVTTDLGSRGIDTLAVRHVILYDVPHTTIDFIHRLGRTGRMGRRGRGIVLVGKNDRKDVIREVREGMFKGQALI